MLESTTARMQMHNLKGARRGAYRHNIMDLMQASGAGFFESLGERGLFEMQTMMGVSSEDSIRERLGSRAKALRGWDGENLRTTAVNKDDEFNARALTDLSSALKQNTEATKANNNLMTGTRAKVNIDAHTE